MNEEEQATYEKLLLVACPACGAQAGSRCVPAPPNTHGEPVTSWGVHQRRVIAQVNAPLAMMPPELRSARALERIAEHFDAEDKRAEQARADAEKARAEHWDRVRALPLVVGVERQSCPFCKAGGRSITRGPQILGCVSCVGDVLRAALHEAPE